MVVHRLLISLSKETFRFRCNMFMSAVDEIDNMGIYTLQGTVMKKYI